MKAIIFDFDGVIVSSEYSTFLLLQDVFRRHELTLPDSTFTERIGKKVNVFVDEILGETVSDLAKKKILDDFYEEFLGDSQGTQHLLRLRLISFAIIKVLVHFILLRLVEESLFLRY